MTVPVRSLRFADAREAADLAAFLGRLLHYDRAAAVRLQAGGGALAVFGRPPSFEVLAIRTARLAGRAGTTSLDVTVSAGELLEVASGRRRTRRSDGARRCRRRAGARHRAAVGRDAAAARRLAASAPGCRTPSTLRDRLDRAVAEFRSRDAALPEERRTRAELDRIGREIWSRTVGDTELPLRAVHAAQSLGFLRPAPGFPVALLARGLAAAAHALRLDRPARRGRRRARHARRDGRDGLIRAGPDPSSA